MTVRELIDALQALGAEDTDVICHDGPVESVSINESSGCVEIEYGIDWRDDD